MRFGLIFSLLILFSKWSVFADEYKFYVKSQAKMYASEFDKSESHLMDITLGQDISKKNHIFKFALENKLIKVGELNLANFVSQESYYQYRSKNLEIRLGYQYFLLTESIGTYAYEDLHAKFLNPSVFSDVDDLLNTTLGLKMTWYKKSWAAEFGIFDGKFRPRDLLYSNKSVLTSTALQPIGEDSSSYMDMAMRIRFQFDNSDLAFYGLSVYEKRFITENVNNTLEFKQPNANLIGGSFSSDIGEAVIRADLMIVPNRERLDKNLNYESFLESLISFNVDYQFTGKSRTSIVLNHRQLPESEKYFIKESANQIFLFHQYQFNDRLNIDLSYLHQTEPDEDSYKLDFDRKVSRNVRLSLGLEKWLFKNDTMLFFDVRAITF